MMLLMLNFGRASARMASFRTLLRLTVIVVILSEFNKADNLPSTAVNVAESLSFLEQKQVGIVIVCEYIFPYMSDLLNSNACSMSSFSIASTSFN